MLGQNPAGRSDGTANCRVQFTPASKGMKAPITELTGSPECPKLTG